MYRLSTLAGVELAADAAGAAGASAPDLWSPQAFSSTQEPSTTRPDRSALTIKPIPHLFCDGKVPSIAHARLLESYSYIPACASGTVQNQFCTRRSRLALRAALRAFKSARRPT